MAIQEAELWLSPALDSRDRHVPVQATHRAEAESAEQQRLTTAQLIAADRGWQFDFTLPIILCSMLMRLRLWSYNSAQLIPVDRDGCSI